MFSVDFTAINADGGFEKALSFEKNLSWKEKHITFQSIIFKSGYQNFE